MSQSGCVDVVAEAGAREPVAYRQTRLALTPEATSSEQIQVQKRKKLTLRHPMNSSHVACSRPQHSQAFGSIDLYHRKLFRCISRTTRSKLNVRGANTADERHKALASR
jgi:hypothetical protein